jgi:ubiquinone biosynthesis protein UbiJ
LSESLPPQKATPAVAFCFVLNHLLGAEPWARERLAAFAGETLELRAPPLPALRLSILPGGTVEAASAMPGRLMTLKREFLVGLARGEEHALRSVAVEGNAELAAEVLVLVRQLRWEMEEDLSRLFGDIAAHRIAEAGRAFVAWHLDAAQRLAGAAADYVTDEKPFLTRRAELDTLAESVAQLRDAIARLDKRLERLC